MGQKDLFCRKARFLGQNPKIGCQKFNDFQTPELSKKQLCDRTPICAWLVIAPRSRPCSGHTTWRNLTIDRGIANGPRSLATGGVFCPRCSVDRLNRPDL